MYAYKKCSSKIKKDNFKRTSVVIQVRTLELNSCKDNEI